MVSFISRVPRRGQPTKPIAFCLVRRKIDILVIDNEIKGHISAENDALLPFSIAGGVQTRKEFPQRKRKVNDVGEIADKLFFEPCIEFGVTENELAIQGRILGHEFQNSMEGIDIWVINQDLHVTTNLISQIMESIKKRGKSTGKKGEKKMNPDKNAYTP